VKNLLSPITKIDLDEAFERYDDKNRGYKDQILTGLDKVMKDLETIREEMTVGTHQMRKLKEEVDTHRKRISKLESPVQ